jgi:hypothetical protein
MVNPIRLNGRKRNENLREFKFSQVSHKVGSTRRIVIETGAIRNAAVLSLLDGIPAPALLDLTSFTQMAQTS